MLCEIAITLKNTYKLPKQISAMVKYLKNHYSIVVCIIAIALIFILLMKQFTSADVVINTDKNTYSRSNEADKIKITIINNLDEPIYFAYRDFANVQIKKDNEWIFGQGIPQGIGPFIYESIPSKERLVVDFKTRDSPLTYEQYRLGRYRFLEIVYLGCKGVGYEYKPGECSGQKTIYSNEFTIYE